MTEIALLKQIREVLEDFPKYSTRAWQRWKATSTAYSTKQRARRRN